MWEKTPSNANLTTKKKYRNRRRSVSYYLYGSNNDVIDRDEDQLHEETDKTHHNEADRNAESNLREFYTKRCISSVKLKFLQDFHSKSVYTSRSSMYVCIIHVD